MKFATWYQREPRGTYKRLHELGVGSATIYKLRKGGTIDSYALASLISEATGGEVSVSELCTGEQPLNKAEAHRLAHELRDPKFYTARTKRAVNSLTVERGPKGGAA